jgi:hypothetical protein
MDPFSECPDNTTSKALRLCRAAHEKMRSRPLAFDDFFVYGAKKEVPEKAL